MYTEPKPQPDRWIPVASLCIGTFSLWFQLFVLYPWHQQLSDDFAILKQGCMT
jgi:hypothetical protein